MGENWPQLRPDLRYLILRPLLEFREKSPDMLAAAETLLAQALEDTARYESFVDSIGKFFYRDPRICDVALCVLHELFPERYAFTAVAGPRLREFERLTALNLGRRQRKQPGLPNPKIDRPKLPPEDALRIGDVTVVGQGAIVPAEYQDVLRSLKGQKFTAEQFITVLAKFATQPPGGFGGIHIQAGREADLTGVDLRVELISGRAPRNSEEWTYWYRGADTHLESSDLTRDRFRETATFAIIHYAITEGLKSAPDQPFDFEAGLKPAEREE